jgi:hypothetical protein
VKLILGSRQAETLADALRLAAEVRDDEARALDSYGEPDEARQQRQAAERIRRLLVMVDGDTPVREDDLSQVLGDAYAYRLGEAYGPDDDDLEDDDRDGLARVQRLAAAFGVDIPA